jgi:hypothetical protein
MGVRERDAAGLEGAARAVGTVRVDDVRRWRHLHKIQQIKASGERDVDGAVTRVSNGMSRSIASLSTRQRMIGERWRGIDVRLQRLRSNRCRSSGVGREDTTERASGGTNNREGHRSEPRRNVSTRAHPYMTSVCSFGRSSVRVMIRHPRKAELMLHGIGARERTIRVSTRVE